MVYITNSLFSVQNDQAQADRILYFCLHPSHPRRSGGLLGPHTPNRHLRLLVCLRQKDFSILRFLHTEYPTKLQTTVNQPHTTTFLQSTTTSTLTSILSTKASTLTSSLATTSSTVIYNLYLCHSIRISNLIIRLLQLQPLL